MGKGGVQGNGSGFITANYKYDTTKKRKRGASGFENTFSLETSPSVSGGVFCYFGKR